MKSWLEAELPDFIEETMENYPDKEITIWFQDESRFGNRTAIAPVWTSLEGTPTIASQQGFKNAYIFGAIEIYSGSSVGLVTEGVSVEFTNEHLSLISKETPESSHAIVIMDNAGFHNKSKKIKIPSNISILNLPPYSPELNPVENLWQYLKGNYLKNRIIKKGEDLISVGCEVWKQVTSELSLSLTKRYRKMFSN